MDLGRVEYSQVESSMKNVEIPRPKPSKYNHMSHHLSQPTHLEKPKPKTNTGREREPTMYVFINTRSL